MSSSSETKSWVLRKEEVGGFLNELAHHYIVYGLVAPDGSVPFDFPNTTDGPKGVLYPQSETLFTYRDGVVEPSSDQSKPILLFGVRPCDAKSLSLLDRVFQEGDYVDPYWKARYSQALVATLGCNDPLPTCFCNWTGGGPFDRQGSDLFLVDLGDSFLVDACSTKGETLIAQSSVMERATDKDRERALELQRNAQSMLGEPVDLAPLVERLDTMWESPFWEEIAQKCLNCAICSYLCPTCHCFDIQDEGNERTGRRIRIWDSCMFPLFTREASGHNPRANGADRVRQRVMHKFNYFVENLGEYGCVGCGRCVRECPVNVDIREVLTGALQYPVPAKK